MSLRFTTTRRVEFRDTDAAGIAHFSVFFVYMEQAEHELLRQLGLSVVYHDEEGEIGWPRVSANCEYCAPARFEELLDVDVVVQRLGSKSVTFAFRFTRGGIEIALGKLTAVCCRMRPGLPPQSIPIPAAIVHKLRGQ
jgi:4-hydroxybenzoyl-CoA thioesterase/acyl-CoA thioester hydrolase